MEKVYLFLDYKTKQWGVAKIVKNTVKMEQVIYFDTYHEANQYCQGKGYIIYYQMR